MFVRSHSVNVFGTGECFGAPSFCVSGGGSISLLVMERPSRFEHARFLGDKRTQLVYDLDSWSDESVIADIVDVGVGIQFGPDTLIEARNRGYTLAKPGVRRLQRKPRA
jgi:hypothetical protein